MVDGEGKSRRREVIVKNVCAVRGTITTVDVSRAPGVSNKDGLRIVYG